MIVFTILGAILAVVGSVWIIVLAFRKSIWWGLGSIFIPFVSLIFCFLNLSETWKPLVMAVVGGVLVGIGGALGGGLEATGVDDNARLDRPAIVWSMPA